MSVKEKPASNRYLEQKEQDKAYRKHMAALANAKSTINTTQPEISGRLRMKAENNRVYRQRALKMMEQRDKMVESNRNKPIADSTLNLSHVSSSRTNRPNLYQDIDLFRQDIERHRVHSSKNKVRPTIDSLITTSSEIEDPSSYESSLVSKKETVNYNIPSDIKRSHEVERIRIGFGSELIETEDPNPSVSTSFVQVSATNKVQNNSSFVGSKVSNESTDKKASESFGSSGSSSQKKGDKKLSAMFLTSPPTNSNKEENKESTAKKSIFPGNADTAKMLLDPTKDDSEGNSFDSIPERNSDDVINSSGAAQTEIKVESYTLNDSKKEVQKDDTEDLFDSNDSFSESEKKSRNNIESKEDENDLSLPDF